MTFSIVKPRTPVLQRGHPLARGLVGAWAMSETSGTRLRDLSGLGSDFVLSGAPTFVGSESGGALSFDGATQYGTAGTTTKYDNAFPAGISLCVLVKIPNYNQFQRMLAFNNVTNDNIDVWIQTYPGTGEVQFGSGGAGNYADTVQVFPLNTWCLLVGTTDYSTPAVYVNGVKYDLAFGAATAYLSDKGSLDLASLVSAGTTYFGEMTCGGALVYNRALPASEVAWLTHDPFVVFRPKSEISRFARAGAASSVLKNTVVMARQAVPRASVW